jgi:hypothetical protein
LPNKSCDQREARRTEKQLRPVQVVVVVVVVVVRKTFQNMFTGASDL